MKKPDGTMEKYAYDYMGNILRAEDGEGHAVLYGYDLNGNMVSRIDQLGARESFDYYPDGSLRYAIGGSMCQ